MLLKISLLLMLGLTQPSLLERIDEINKSDNIANEEKVILLEDYLNEHKDSDSLAVLYHRAAQVIMNVDLKKTMDWQQKAVKMMSEQQDTVNLVKSLYNLGYYQRKSRLYTAMEQTYLSIIAFNDTSKITGKSYSALGEISKNKGDYFRADKYYIKADEILTKLGDPKSILDNKLRRISLAIKMGSVENQEEILYLMNQVDSLVAVHPPKDKNTYDILTRKSYLNDDFGRIDEAIRDIKKALELARKIGEIDRIVNAYNNLAISYTKNKDFESAINAINQVITYDSLSKYGAASYNNLGDIYKKMGDDNQALYNYQKSIDTYLQKYKYPDLSVVQLMERCQFQDYLMLAIVSKIDFFKYKFDQTGNTSNLDSILNSVKLGDKLLEILRSGSFENMSKLYWREKAHTIYGKGIWAATKLNDMDSYFYFMEKNKAILLLENLSETQAQIIGGIPDETVKRGRSLKRKSLDQLEDGMDSYFVYHNFLDSVNRAFPKYSNIKQQMKVLSLEQVLNNFDFLKKGVVLQYFVDNANAYGLHIAKDSVFKFMVGDLKGLSVESKEFKILCSKPLLSKEELAAFANLSHNLRKKLIPPAIVATDQLIIIADGFLQDIPFEALASTSEISQLKSRFLINDYEVSYAYSVSHLMENNALERNNESGFLGVAPGRFSDPHLAMLKNSSKEVMSACDVMKGELFIGEDASKVHFLEQMDQYQTIHLSTHANSGSIDSTWISFRDEKLSGSEIYGEKNDAELIVLSACRTSLGEMIAGEGIMSLSRAFFHAGAASVLSTLWNVNDQVSVEIIADFYRALVAGKSRAAALRTAKLNYLSSHSGSEISPYFWSSYIMIGDGSKLNLNSNKTTSKTLITSIVLIVVVIVFIAFMRKKTLVAKNA